MSPINENISVEIKNKRQKVAGSLKKNIPTTTVPTAPIPVHTAYAVPIGNVCDALYNRYILIERQIKNPLIHSSCVLPVVPFALPRQVANAVSKRPAMMRSSQFILCN